MRKYVLGFIIGIGTLFLLAADQRNTGLQYPVAKYSTTQLSWVASDANDKSTTLYNLNGTIERMDIVISDANVTKNATFSFADAGGTALVSWTADMNSAQRLLKLATSDSTDFNALPVCGNLVATVDPNTGPVGVTWTVDFNIYVR